MDLSHYAIEAVGFFFSLIGIGVMFLYQRQVKSGDAAAEREAATEKRELEAYKAQVHEDFQKLHQRVDSEREERERAKDHMHELELKLAEAVKREEMEAVFSRIDKIKTEVISALSTALGRNGQ